jgi:uncharacterized Zn finger protein
VRDQGEPFQPWVGFVDGELVGECDCPDDEDDTLCAHAVALALRALDEGVRWSGAAVPPSEAELDPLLARFTDAAEQLSRRRLIELVAAQALKDPLLGALLLDEADEDSAEDD